VYEPKLGGGVTPLLLDTYSGATAAYSLRKLKNTYTGNAIRVRRSSDNTSQDIGFDANGNLDTASMLSFVGAGNGFVSIWYDQGGANANFTQDTLVNQPRIVSSGVVYTINGKPAISYGQQVDYWYLQSPVGFLSNTSTPILLSGVWKITDYNGASNAGVFAPSLDYGVGLEIIQVSLISRRSLLRVENSIKNDNSSESYQLWNNASQSLTNICLGTSTVSAYKNNNIVSLTNTSSVLGLNPVTYYAIGRYAGVAGNYYSYMDAQEIVIMLSNQIPNVNGINTNINSYYSIY
jgi:hypothetical protein